MSKNVFYLSIYIFYPTPRIEYIIQIDILIGHQPGNTFIWAVFFQLSSCVYIDCHTLKSYINHISLYSKLIIIKKYII